MAKPGSKTTAEEALGGRALSGKQAIVTGASSGLGVETSRVLALAGANVVMAVRNLEAGEKVAATLRTSLGANAGKLELALLNLADLDSVRAFATQVLGRNQKIDLLINNAGIMATPFSLAKVGVESQLATNHLGHFLLTTLLKPALASDARVVNVSSDLHKRGKAQSLIASLGSDRGFKARKYTPFGAYGDSKLANVLFTRALAKRLQPGQSAFSLHPGVIATNLSRDLTGGAVFRFFTRLFSKNVAQGAATSIFAATEPALQTQSGAYLADCAVAESSSDGRDLQLAEEVWRLSEERVGRS